MDEIHGIKYSFFFILLTIAFNNMLMAQHPEIRTASDNSNKDINYLLKEDKVRARAWYLSWLSLYGTATIVQSGIAIGTPDLRTRQDMWNSSATTFLGAIGLLLTPIVPKNEEIMKTIPADDDSISRERMFSETFLKELAKREKAGRSWKVHAAAGLVDLGSGLVTWVGFDRSLKEGIITFAINTAVAEAQIWTQPLRAAKDFQRCKSYSFGSPGDKAKWYLSAKPGGLSIRCIF